MEQDKRHKVVEALLCLYEPLEEVNKAIVEDASLDSSLKANYLNAHSSLLDAIDKILRAYEKQEKARLQLEN